ncbi:hypothetical protein AB1L30_00980, partial [Bremerella sp. JC817]|uniref:hypothetical protein n=1 Tax=Bremerella sp. JC817 TaxID=3231756 RepID=UPI003457EC14
CNDRDSLDMSRRAMWTWLEDANDRENDKHNASRQPEAGAAGDLVHIDKDQGASMQKKKEEGYFGNENVFEIDL